MAGSSVAGIITAIGTTLIAGGGFVTAVGVLIPILRGTKRNTEALRVQQVKLGVIHTLVNSTLSAALQAQLDSCRRELAMMVQMTQMQADNGDPITDIQREAMGGLRRTIDQLSLAMKERDEQTRSANLQLEYEAERTR